MDPNQSSIIGASYKKLYRLDVRAATKEVFNKRTAYQIRKAISNHLVSKDIDAKILEVKYIVRATQGLLKFQQNIRKELPPIERQFNNISGNAFLEYVFKDIKRLEPKRAFQQESEQELRLQQKVELEQINFIDSGLSKLMQVYLGDEESRLFTNNLNMGDGLKNKQLIDCKAVLLIHKSTYEQKFKNEKIYIDQDTIFVDIPKGINAQIDNESLDKLRNLTPITSWKLGTKQDLQTSSQFYTYFDTQVIFEKAKRMNSSINLNSFLSRESAQRVKRFQIFTELFNRMAIKLSIKVNQIQEVTKKEVDNQMQYYLKLTHPPKFFFYQYTYKLSQDETYMDKWKRIQNFSLLRNENIQKDEFLRLHLYKNTYLKISAHRTVNKKSIQFLENLIYEFKIKTEKRNLVDKKEIKTLQMKLGYDKFGDSLALSALTNQSGANIWKLKYYILCLLTNGSLMVGQVAELTTFIEKIGNYTMFFNIFEKMCNNEQRGLKYIKQKAQELKKWPKQLLLLRNQIDESAFIFRMHITPSGYLYMTRSPEMKNRLVRQYIKDIEYFMRVSILDDDGKQIKNQLYLTKRIFRKMMASYKVIDRKYIPLGWSPSQLRNFSLWYINQKQGFKRSQILDFLGRFSQITPDAKKAARIGQSFSSSWYFNIGKPIIQTIPDIKAQNGKLFTDGIGKISKDLIERISLKLQFSHSLGVIQIRYKGAKGILALDQGLPKNTIHLRPSMIKYQAPHSNAEKYLDILDWNKYKHGYLNRQIIILLRTRGVEDKIFMNLQNEYINDIKSLTFKECTIFKELINSQTNQQLFNIEPANKTILNLVKSGFILDQQPFFKGVLQILKRNGYQKLKEKSNINVKKSARLIGIIDEFKVLKQGEIYCRIEDPFDDKPPATIAEDVIVVRNPCLHPGDIRKLSGVSEEQIIKRFTELKKYDKKMHPFSYFTNTVIFSQMGEMPVTCEISGSDLDGDNFFICWDQRLYTLQNEQPYIIIDATSKLKETIAQKPITDEDYKNMLDFFVDYMNYEQLGKIANSHLVRADQDLTNYARSSQCIALAKAHGNAVDFPKTGVCPQVDQKLFVNIYPDFMEKEDYPTYVSASILGKLYRDIKQRIQNVIEKQLIETKEIYLDADLLKVNPNLDYADNQIESAITVYEAFTNELSNIKYLAGLANQFQIYTGNVTSKEKKAFKHSKMIEQIVTLKKNFLDIFFKIIQSDTNKSETLIDRYLQVSRNQLTGSYFGPEYHRLAVLWYLISYTEYFTDLKYIDMNCLNNFKAKVRTVREQKDFKVPKEKCIGLVWFVVPKILMDIKIGKSKEIAEIKNLNSTLPSIEDDYDQGQQLYETQEID